jgi:protein involved in polysaccharide export with SLBB domain
MVDRATSRSLAGSHDATVVVATPSACGEHATHASSDGDDADGVAHLSAWWSTTCAGSLRLAPLARRVRGTPYMRMNAYRRIGRIGSRSATRAHVLVRALGLLAALTFFTLRPVDAQQPGVVTVAPTRQTLEQRATAAEEAAAKAQDGDERRRWQDELTMLRSRLRDGDFLPGDRMLLSTTRGDTPRDTVVVRADTSVVVAGLAPISLKGILRSELSAHLTTQLGRFVREPSVSVVPLLRVGIFGSVARAGYYEVSTGARLSDLLMQAGGPAQGADPQKLVVRRGSEELLTRDATKDALARGKTLDELGLRAGDELFIPTKRTFSWSQVIQGTAVLASVVTLLLSAR